MSSEEYKKAFLFLSNKCSKKEISSREALVLSAKFHLKMVEKNNLINELKKKNLSIIYDMLRHLFMINLFFINGGK